jgi:4-hydroxy-3-methylbut-2-en-1-yl diphosphate synthase IspG/GcpE
MALVFRSYPGRRPSREVKTGRTAIGGENPVRVQSMLTSDTMDTAACMKETLGLAQAGCEIVRITAPTVKDARNLEASLKFQRQMLMGAITGMEWLNGRFDPFGEEF